MNPNFTSHMASNNKVTMKTTEFAPSNPFSTQTCRNGFSVNAKAFTPSVSITNTKSPVTMNSTFFPTSNTQCASNTSLNDSQCESKTTVQKYKTELCKNWIENNSCRYGKKCQFAHGEQELAAFKAASNAEERQRTKNCKTFYKEKQCNYGSRCMFRHEHRHYNQIARHFYVAKLYTVESLY